MLLPGSEVPGYLLTEKLGYRLYWLFKFRGASYAASWVLAFSTFTRNRPYKAQEFPCYCSNSYVAALAPADHLTVLFAQPNLAFQAIARTSMG